MSSAPPRVSVLIPNYNNGRQSSVEGRFDLIGELLQSLYDTLHDDPTPLEIIAYDDGSTDDSLATLRSWSQKTWRGGEAFLSLIEAPHCGVLARNANVLVRKSRGSILVRLDGDTQMLTRHWASKLCEIFDQGPKRLGVIGPKQLRPDGRIHAFGDWLLHPKGYHHIAAGMAREAVRRPMEVDHVMGCFYCCKREVFDRLEGYDETILRGQTIDFGLRARLKGYACFAVPHIEYVHRHGLRAARATKADSAEGVRQTLDTFRRKWGFDRIAPDLDAVRERYAGTDLLWNARYFAMPGDGSVQRPAAPKSIEESEWGRYAKDAAFRKHIDFRIAATMQVIGQLKGVERVVVPGCETGLTVHLLAKQGLVCVGTDGDAGRIALARQWTRQQEYPKGGVRFEHQAEARRQPVAAGEADLVLLCDQMEQHENPVGLLGQAWQALGENKWLMIIAQRKVGEPAATDREHRYGLAELCGQMQAAGGWQVLVDPRSDDLSRPMLVVAQRRASVPAAVEDWAGGGGEGDTASATAA
jgi:glycosyltransferase involved in cell wall biosynthesis